MAKQKRLPRVLAESQGFLVRQHGKTFSIYNRRKKVVKRGVSSIFVALKTIEARNDF